MKLDIESRYCRLEEDSKNFSDLFTISLMLTGFVGYLAISFDSPDLNSAFIAGVCGTASLGLLLKGVRLNIAQQAKKQNERQNF